MLDAPEALGAIAGGGRANDGFKLHLKVALAATCLGLWLLWIGILGGAFGEAENRIDFHDVWAGASLAADGDASAAYDDARLAAEQEGLPGSDTGFYKWLYPPVFFLFVLPLGVLPWLAAFVLWVVATASLAITAVRRASGEWMALAAFMAPATFFNFLIGQNGLLTAGLFAWGMLLLRDRPVVAGAVLGLMTYKPQFFPLVLLALLAGKEWRAAAAACGTAAAIAVTSLVAFGPATWDAFFETAADAGREIYRDGGFVTLEKMASVSAMLTLAGVSATVSQVAQILASLAGAIVVVVLWHRKTVPEYRFAGLALASLLATPYLYQYDLTLLALAVLWMGIRLRAGSELILWHRALFVVALMAPVLGTAMAQQTGVVIGPMVILSLLVLVCAKALPGSSRTSLQGVISGVRS